MIDKVSRELGYPKDVVKLVYRSQYKFIIETIRKLPLDKDMSKEDFDKLKTNFALLDFGKLYCIWENVQARKRYYECFHDRIKRIRYARRKAAERYKAQG